MRSRNLRLALVLLVAALAPATQAPAQTSLNVPAATYTIYTPHTQVIFGIRHLGLSTFYGTVGHVTGTLNFDPAQPEKSALNVQIDMNSIATPVEELNNTLKSSVFHSDKFPSATFAANRIVKTGANTGTVTGNLTVAGVTKPITLNVTFNGGRRLPLPMVGYRIGFDATGTIKRSDFGLTHVIWNGFVSDEVNLIIDCEMEKK
ncbi:MAG TPA: YceI family protein [Rhizomicrobium sp.]|nr:YceI family protein [Rhizomicrobium sp.]